MAKKRPKKNKVLRIRKKIRGILGTTEMESSKISSLCACSEHLLGLGRKRSTNVFFLKERERERREQRIEASMEQNSTHIPAAAAVGGGDGEEQQPPLLLIACLLASCPTTSFPLFSISTIQSKKRAHN
jgi:hypothetical protein